MSIINQKEYLKKYLSLGDEKEKNKKRKKKERKFLRDRVKIIDDDLDEANNINEKELNEFLTAEDAPQVVGIIDERPLSMRIDDYRKSDKWKLVGSDDELKEPENKSESIKKFKVSLNKNPKSDSDLSPTRNRQSDSDCSPPRKSKNSFKDTVKSKSSNPKGNIVKRKSRFADASPPRKSIQDSDADTSPPRKTQHRSESTGTPPRNARNNCDSDTSPPRKTRKKSESDTSPPRRSRKNSDSDVSPTRKTRKKSTSGISPSRKTIQKVDTTNTSPRRSRTQSDSDVSPARKQKKYSDSDNSPVRTTKRITNSDLIKSDRYSKRIEKPENSRNKYGSDSPVRKTNKYDDRRDKYPSNSSSRRDKRSSSPLRNKSRQENVEKSDPKSQTKKMTKTLDGKTAGLQFGNDLKHETAELKQREDELFKTMSAEISGKNAAPIMRDRKTGKRRDLEQEVLVEIEKQQIENVRKEKYDKWGKGLKQIEDRKEKVQEEIHEMAKPLARYADDEDLEKYLRDQEREGDPMLQYIRKKKKKQAETSGNPVDLKPKYEGEFMPNRFGIPPGHRWDGVDRSCGYEKSWFKVQNEKKAVQDEIYKWSTEDM